ncbi:unnamed protein product [Albugo candida]|uniref:Uncharacterized protein n=1 Tax=Albugo candida TaxID=65357 RepID=A0A024G057_9STRA|nr:unnamed protein product [Albugo candida]|eukprot:CCI40153.1 unnamed protein product [Albugo candida]
MLKNPTALPPLREAIQELNGVDRSNSRDKPQHKMEVKRPGKQSLNPQAPRTLSVGNQPHRKIQSHNTEHTASSSTEMMPIEAWWRSTASLIPQEFHIVETNFVIPNHLYPEAQHQSTYCAQKKQWETIIFPALQPRTRQQVIHLQEALQKMIQQHEVTSDAVPSLRCDRIMAEYKIYQLCFHELIRQMHYHCREQGDLLFHIYMRYDEMLKHLIDSLGQQELTMQKLKKELQPQQQLVPDQIISSQVEDEVKDLKPTIQVEETRSCECHAKTAQVDRMLWQIKRLELEIHRLTFTKSLRRDLRGDTNLDQTEIICERLRVLWEKMTHAAALIQRRFRAFRVYKYVKHHRAVARAVKQRQRQVAAIKCIQTGVRSFLTKTKKKDTRARLPADDNKCTPVVQSTSCLHLIDSVTVALPESKRCLGQESLQASTRVEESMDKDLTLAHARELCERLNDMLGCNYVQMDTSPNMQRKAILEIEEVLPKTYVDATTSTSDFAPIVPFEMVQKPQDEMLDDESDLLSQLREIQSDSLSLSSDATITPWQPSYHSITQTPCLNSTNTAETLLVALSRKQKTKLITLRHFMTTIYDILLDKMETMLRPQQTYNCQWRPISDELIATKSALCFSVTEWRAGWDDRSLLDKLDIVHAIQQHFRFQFGLESLTKSAWTQLIELLKEFSSMHPDVQRFQQLLTRRTDSSDVIFYLICRQLAWNQRKVSQTNRSLLVHPESICEVVTMQQAQSMAWQLFRVDDEAQITAMDEALVDINHHLYRRYLPKSGYLQFDQLTQNHISKAIVTKEMLSEGLKTKSLYQNQSKHKNAKSFSLHGPKSLNLPMVDDIVMADEYVYFEKVVDLLCKYRTEAYHFHSCLSRILELFGDNCGLTKIQFIDRMMPFTISTTEREFANIYHCMIRASSHVEDELMTRSVFVSTVLELVHNKMLKIVC